MGCRPYFSNIGVRTFPKQKKFEKLRTLQIMSFFSYLRCLDFFFNIKKIVFDNFLSIKSQRGRVKLLLLGTGTLDVVDCIFLSVVSLSDVKQRK